MARGGGLYPRTRVCEGGGGCVLCDNKDQGEEC